MAKARYQKCNKPQREQAHVLRPENAALQEVLKIMHKPDT